MGDIKKRTVRMGINFIERIIPSYDISSEKGYRRLLEQCQKYDVISFDVFDTLLIRTVPNTYDVFDIISERLAKEGIIIPDFKEKRITSQKKAKGKKLFKLEEIYKVMSEEYGISPEACSRAEVLEVTVESDVCIANNFMLKMVKKLIEKGKQIFFISDMHLSKKQLLTVMHSNGIKVADEHNVFVSCEYGATKSEGELFKIAIKEAQANGKNIVHIGDSIKGDYVMPRVSVGINSIAIDRIELVKIDKLLVATMPNEESDLYKWGFTIVGPVMYLFCKWIREQGEVLGITDYLFLTREGAFFCELFQMLYKNADANINVMYASRRSISAGAASSNFEMYKRMRLLSNNSMEELLIDIGLEDDKDYVLLKHRFQPSDKVMNTKDIEGIFDEYKDRILKKSKSDRERIIKYVQSLIKGDRPAIIDIGWRGTSQCLVQEIFDENDISTEFEGLYFAVLNESMQQYKKYGFLADSSKKKMTNHIANAGFVFENIFLKEIGQTYSYEIIGDEIVPLLDESKMIQNEKVKDIQRGIIDLIKLICDKPSIANVIGAHSENVIKKLFSDLDKPSKRLSEELGDIMWTDDGSNVNYIAKPMHKTSYYFTHPKALISELGEGTGWKSGYLTRVFVCGLNYYSIYNLFKKIRNF